MTDRNTISQVIESLFEDWIDKNINAHPLAVENMRMLETDALSLLKEQEAVKPTWGRGKPFCGACGLQIRGGKFCSECGKPIAWEGR